MTINFSNSFTSGYIFLLKAEPKIISLAQVVWLLWITWRLEVSRDIAKFVPSFKVCPHELPQGHGPPHQSSSNGYYLFLNFSAVKKKTKTNSSQLTRNHVWNYNNKGWNLHSRIPCVKMKWSSVYFSNSVTWLSRWDILFLKTPKFRMLRLH